MKQIVMLTVVMASFIDGFGSEWKTLRLNENLNERLLLSPYHYDCIRSDYFNSYVILNNYEVSAASAVNQGVLCIRNLYEITDSYSWVSGTWYHNGNVHIAVNIADNGFQGNDELVDVSIINERSHDEIDDPVIKNSLVGLTGYDYDGSDYLRPVSTIETFPVVTNVGRYAFSMCSQLNRFTADSGIVSIGDNAFAGSGKLSFVCLGKDIQRIGYDAFVGTYVTNLCAECAPPQGLMESKALENYPSVTYPLSSAEEWRAIIVERSTNLYVRIADNTNIIVEAGAYKTIILNCDEERAKIYYTLDGTDPTTNSALYTTKFKVKPEGKMTIKASAIIDRWPYHSVQSITLAPGKCEAPSASMADGEKFYFRNQNVSLATATANGVIRYTLDGSEPTEASAVYVSPIVISETTTIKAKAFRDDYFDSDVMTVTLVRDWYQVATPNIVAYYGLIQEGNEKTTFEGSHVSVVITNATEEVAIHYTVDGTEPTEESPTYVAPFKVFENTTVKAMAIKDDWKSSVVAMTVLVKQYGIGDVMKDADTTFVNDATYPWVEDSTVFYSGVSSMRSGTAPDRTKSTLTTEVIGAGRVLFRWKADCESDTYDHEFDHGEFRIDNVESVVRIDGLTGWRSEDVRIEGEGAHTLAWIYQKDDGDEKGYSGGNIWVDNFVWIPDDGSKVTYRSENEVPYNWLYHYGLLKERVPEVAVVTETGKRDSSGKALTPEADYVAGTDPTNLTSVFTAFIDMSTGIPDVSWDPDLNEKGTKSLRDYKVWGKEALNDGTAWEWPTNALHRFFKVTVEMK